MKYIKGLQHYVYMYVKHMYYTHISLSVHASYTQIHRNAFKYRIYPTTTTGFRRIGGIRFRECLGVSV